MSASLFPLKIQILGFRIYMSILVFLQISSVFTCVIFVVAFKFFIIKINLWQTLKNSIIRTYQLLPQYHPESKQATAMFSERCLRQTPDHNLSLHENNKEMGAVEFYFLSQEINTCSVITYFSLNTFVSGKCDFDLNCIPN